MRNFDLPYGYTEATTNEPLVLDWAAAAARGENAKLLVLAPGWSGKTHTLYAALRLLQTAGVPCEHIFARDWTDSTKVPTTSEVLRHRIVLLDPADQYDPHYYFDADGDPEFEATQSTREAELVAEQDGWEEPEDADEALYRQERDRREIDLRIQLSRLTYSFTHSALVTATSESTMLRGLGEDLSVRLLEWPTLRLPKRPSTAITW